MAGKKMPGIMAYFSDYLPMMEALSTQEFGELMTDVFRYAGQGLPPKSEIPMVKAFFAIARSRVDLDAEAYERKVTHSRYAAYTKKRRAAGAEPVPYEDWVEQQSYIINPLEVETTGINPLEVDSSGINPLQVDSRGINPLEVETTGNDLNQEVTTGLNIKHPETNYNNNNNNNYNSNSNNNNNYNSKYKDNINTNAAPAAGDGLRRPSSETKEKDKRSLPKWADAPETMKEEIGELTREVFSKFVPSRLPEKADALKMYERVCAVDDDGKIYVNAERTQLVCEAFAHAQEEGKPGNSVAIYRYLKEVSA